MSRTSGCGARHGKVGLRRPSAAGALACRRSTTALAAATERHRSASAYALPETRSERATPTVRKTARLFRGRCPRLPAPVQRVLTRRPVVVPAGRILPKPPGSGGDEPPPAGTAPLRQPVSPGGRPVGERDRQYVTENRIDVKTIVAINATTVQFARRAICRINLGPCHEFVMAGLVPAIHIFAARLDDVDARDKHGHDKAIRYRRDVKRPRRFRAAPLVPPVSPSS